MSQEATEQAKPAKKKGKLPLILGAVAVLALGGGGGYWFLKPAPVAAEEEAAEAPKKKAAHAKAEEPSGVVKFEPFVVNLADDGGGRFLRVTIQLVVPGEETAKEIEENKVQMARLRAEVLELLADQTSDDLVTSDGKADLKDAIAERASEILEEHEVTDVLFSDFLVQF